MPLPTLSDYRARRDPAPSWRWVATLPQLPATQPGMTPGSYNVRSLGNRSVYCEGSSLPVPSIEAAPFFAGSKNEYYPQFYSVEPANFVFSEDDTYLVYRYLHTWRSLVVDEKNNWGMPSVYKLIINLQLYGWDNTVALSVNLMGCWPTQRPAYDLAYSQSDYIRSNCVFSVDNTEPDIVAPSLSE